MVREQDIQARIEAWYNNQPDKYACIIEIKVDTGLTAGAHKRGFIDLAVWNKETDEITLYELKTAKGAIYGLGQVLAYDYFSNDSEQKALLEATLIKKFEKIEKFDKISNLRVGIIDYYPSKVKMEILKRINILTDSDICIDYCQVILDKNDNVISIIEINQDIFNKMEKIKETLEELKDIIAFSKKKMENIKHSYAICECGKEDSGVIISDNSVKDFLDISIYDDFRIQIIFTIVNNISGYSLLFSPSFYFHYKNGVIDSNQFQESIKNLNINNALIKRHNWTVKSEYSEHINSYALFDDYNANNDNSIQIGEKLTEENKNWIKNKLTDFVDKISSGD